MTTSVIIGAGIVGLHVANALLEKGHEVYVLDAAPYLAEHTSGRNSGVIHAGIFYKTGSFKERVCIEGNPLTHEWVKKLNVAHIPCGKWVVAEPGQENDFEPFYERLQKLPIPKPVIKSADDVAKLEPNLRRTKAILIPSTGVLDAAGYVKAMAHFVETKGAHVILNCRVTEVKDNTLTTSRGEIPFDLLINSAGLNADVIAQSSGLAGYEIKPCRGDYYVINAQPLKRPVYHLPYTSAQGWLGVHLTPTFDGQTIVGPNAFFIDDKTDYQHHSDIKTFEDSVRMYVPSMQEPKLTHGYAGNRPRLFINGKALTEFTFVKHKNTIHLLGIESPGLTAAPVLAKHVLSLL